MMDFGSSFTFYLPESWSWFERERRESRSQPALGQLVEAGENFHFGTYPFGAEVDDVEISFLAVPISDTAEFDGEPALTQALITADAFMVVAKSSLLNDLTYDETIQFLLNSNYRILGAEQVETLDISYLEIQVETPIPGVDDFEFLRCRQQFYLGQDESMLVTLCAKDSIYTSYQRTFNDILTSFRRLS
jgi:hypothetical protein